MTDVFTKNSQLYILFFSSSSFLSPFRMSIKWWVIISATSDSVYASRRKIILLFLENRSYFLNQEIEATIKKIKQKPCSHQLLLDFLQDAFPFLKQPLLHTDTGGGFSSHTMKISHASHVTLMSVSVFLLDQVLTGDRDYGHFIAIQPLSRAPNMKLSWHQSEV